MAKKRKGNNLGPVAVRRLAAKRRKRPADGEAANGQPHAAQRIIEFPQPRAGDNVISDRITFEVGDSRFAIQWTAEIEQLPPAGPVAVQQQQRLK